MDDTVDDIAEVASATCADMAGGADDTAADGTFDKALFLFAVVVATAAAGSDARGAETGFCGEFVSDDGDGVGAAAASNGNGANDDSGGESACAGRGRVLTLGGMGTAAYGEMRRLYKGWDFPTQ